MVLLSITDQYFESIEKDPTVDLQRVARIEGDATKLDGFVQNKVVPHFHVEERIVFPMLERLDNMDKMLVDGCRAEHEKILAEANELKRFMSEPLDVTRAARVWLLVSHIVKDLEVHVGRENEMISAAKRLITQEQEKALDRVLREMGTKEV